MVMSMYEDEVKYMRESENDTRPNAPTTAKVNYVLAVWLSLPHRMRSKLN